MKTGNLKKTALEVLSESATPTRPDMSKEAFEKMRARLEELKKGHGKSFNAFDHFSSSEIKAFIVALDYYDRNGLEMRFEERARERSGELSRQKNAFSQGDAAARGELYLRPGTLPEIRMAIVRDPHASPELLAAVVTSDDKALAFLAAINPRTPEESLRQAMKSSPFTFVREACATSLRHEKFEASMLKDRREKAS